MNHCLNELRNDHPIIIVIMGEEGVWLAFTFFMIMRAVTLGIFYPRVEIDAK